jgi:chromosome segregation ATPase
MSDTKDIVQRLQCYDERCDIDIEDAIVEITRLRADLAQRTAERDAAKAHFVDAWRERSEFAKRIDEADADLAQRTAELAKAEAERDEAINKYNELVKSPVLAFVKNKWLSNATSIEMVFTHEFMQECPDVLVEQIAADIKHAMMKEMNESSSTAEWTPVRFGSSVKKTMDKYEPIMKKISELDGEK